MNIKKMKPLDLLIITYNRPEDTLALLHSLANQKDTQQYLNEVFLLNNASSVSYQIVEDFIKHHIHLPINYISHHENLGVAGGRNFLISKAQAPYLFFLDDDVVFDDEYAVQNAASIFKKQRYIENNTGIITCDIRYFSDRSRQVSAFPHKDLNAYKDKDWFLTYYFTGAAHIIKNEVFAQTGLYPPDFFYGMEEYDLSYRVLNAGFTLGYDNSILILHKESKEGRVSNTQKTGMMWCNKSKVAWRYLPKKYYYSTAFMWGLHYLKKTSFDLKGFFKCLVKVMQISKSEKQTPISEKSLHYLKENHARLWY